jgi:hypothetical protein
MAKAKSKGNFKQLLLNKGEYIALGAAGFFLVVLFGWGVSRWAGAQDPADLSNKLTSDARTLQSRITSGPPTDQDKEQYALPAWVTGDSTFRRVPASDFPLQGPQFDPIARPDTKRENPSVIKLGEYQADVAKVAMMGYDIQKLKEDEPPRIAVIVGKAVGEQNKDKLKNIGKKFAERVKENQRKLPPNPNLNGPPMGGAPMGGGLGPPPMGGGMGQPMGGGSSLGPAPGAGGAGNPYGSMGGTGYNASAQRVEKAIQYISIDELDKAIDAGQIPAKTVIPLRAVIIHAEVPYRAQLEEIKRALRLPTLDEARKWGPIYDGYEVQRRVTRVGANGKEVVLVDWPTDKRPNFDFEARYADLINARKLNDNFEDGWLAHFIRYDMALALPLPLLVEELGKYPDIRLPGIKATIEKMKKANLKPETPSDVLKRLTGNTDRNSLYRPQTPADTASGAFFGAGVGADGRPAAGMPPMGTPPAAPGLIRPGDNAAQTNAPPVEIEHLLLRLIDVDVQPGLTYQYRIRLRMLNPNHGEKMLSLVSNPAYTKEKELYSPWTQVRDSITIPTEAFVYAADPAAYRKKIEEEYKEQKDRDLKERLQVKDNQVVVEMHTWMEEVRISSNQREPIGSWVVADIPVGRGEFIGRKHYVKLPLWSSVTTQYVLREIAEKISAKKDATPPKGWLVDFTTQSVLVDFEGGRVKTRLPGRDVNEDAGTEMLILRADGKLEVKKSLADEGDVERQKIVGEWEGWIKKVETRKEGGADDGFERKDKKDN